MSAKKPGEWPLEHAEFERWVADVSWQDAVTRPMNPHAYTLKRNTKSPRMFELVVLHIREYGSQEWFGGQEYTYYECAGYKYWTMMNPIEFTILINCKQLPKESDSSAGEPDEEEQPNMDETLPELYTARYLAQDVLASGMVVPVRISMYPPEHLIPLGYEVEHEVRALMPERRMHAEWHKFSPTFWRHLDTIGLGRIAKELSAISERHEGKPLALCCYEDLLKGQRCHRVIAAAWIQEQTGIAVPELTNEGEVLGLDDLHPQVMPVRPR